MDTIKELGKLLKDNGVQIKFGLEAQGRIPTVERMLDEGSSWDDIGRAIGWHGETAHKFYQRYLERSNKR